MVFTQLLFKKGELKKMKNLLPDVIEVLNIVLQIMKSYNIALEVKSFIHL